MEQIAVEYLVNAFWQLPVLALGAWLLLKLCRPQPATQHRAWLAVLALGLLLPLRGIIPSRPAPSLSELPIATAVSIGEAEANASYHAVQGEAPVSLHPVSAPDLPQNAIPSTGRTWLGSTAAALSASVHPVSVSAALAQWIVGLWLAVALWGMLRIVLAWLAAQRLVAASRDAPLDERRRATLAGCALRVGVAVPEIRESDRIAGPVVVGAANPVLLWPRNFAQTSYDEMRAALCHELAHIQRRDYAMNLLCEMVALPLKWHPATHRVERRVRATREMACDAVAANAMGSETVYADCLVRLARNIVSGGAEGFLAAGLFSGNVMEERVMRLIAQKSTMSVRAKVVRGAAGATAMLATAAVAAAFHLTPAMAQEIPAPPPAPAQVTPAAPPALVQAAPAIAPAIPAVAPAPVKFSPSIALAPAAPTVLTPSIPVGVKVPAAPLVPAISAAVPVPLAPMVAPQVNVQPPPAVPPQTHSSKPIVIKRGKIRDLTPAERARIEKQLADAQRKLAAATAKIDSPEFQRQLEDAQLKASQLVANIDSAEFQKRMADAQKQLADAEARIDSPEFQRQLEEAQRKATQAVSQIDSAAFQKQMADAQAAALRAQTKLNSTEFRKQMADAQKQIAAVTARLNSPEFRKEIEDAARAASAVNSAQFQKQMADAQKQLADALAKMKADQEKAARK